MYRWRIFLIFFHNYLYMSFSEIAQNVLQRNYFKRTEWICFHWLLLIWAKSDLIAMNATLVCNVSSKGLNHLSELDDLVPGLFAFLMAWTCWFSSGFETTRQGFSASIRSASVIITKGFLVPQLVPSTEYDLKRIPNITIIFIETVHINCGRNGSQCELSYLELPIVNRLLL